MKTIMAFASILAVLLVAANGHAQRTTPVTVVNNQNNPVPVDVVTPPTSACQQVAITVRNTVATTTGNGGSRVGMQDLCEAELPGSHFCSNAELNGVVDRGGVVVWRLTASGGSIWIDTQALVADTNNCNGWTSAGPEDGRTIDVARTAISGSPNCSNDFPVACCE